MSERISFDDDDAQTMNQIDSSLIEEFLTMKNKNYIKYEKYEKYIHLIRYDKESEKFIPDFVPFELFQDGQKSYDISDGVYYYIDEDR